MTPVPPPPHLRRNDSRGALNVVRPPLRPPLLRRIDSRTSLAPGSFQQPRPVRAPFIRPPFNGTPPRPPEPGFRPLPPGIRPSPRPYLSQPPFRDGLVTSVEGGFVGVEASNLQQQVYLNNSDQKSLDPEHKQNILSFVKSRTHSMEHPNQVDDFDRPVSRTGGDMFSVNGHLKETQQKSPEPQKVPSAPAKIHPVAPLDQKVPVPTQSVPSESQNPLPFAGKVPPMIASELERPPLATYSVVGPDFQRPISAISNVDAGEFHKLPSAASGVISAELQMPPPATSSAISAAHERPLSAASRVITAEIERPQPIVRKPESSKVMNGVAVKPAEDVKKGHAGGAEKQEDDDNDVIIMKSPGTMSSSSEEVVAGGKPTGAATDEGQQGGKPVSVESRFAENMRFEVKASTVADTKSCPKKQELEESEGKEDVLKKIDEKNISGNEGKVMESKEEESPKKEHLRDEEIVRRSTEILKDSWKKESEKTVEDNEMSANKQIEEETTKKKESLSTALDITSQTAGIKDKKPADWTGEETCKNTEQAIKEITLKSEESVKKEIEKGNNRKEAVCSNNELSLKEQKGVPPENVAELSKKGSVKTPEKEVEVKEGFKKEEGKNEFSSNLRENESVRTGASPSVDAEVVKKESTQQKDQSKDETSGESYKKPVEETKTGSPRKEETKETGRREESLTKENETETLEKSRKEKEEELMKGRPKKEEGREDSLKKAIEDIKDSPKKENKNEIEKYSEASTKESPKQKPETLITKEEQSLKNEGEIFQKKEEETEIVKKAESLKKETNNYVEEKASTKETKNQPEEKKSENKFPLKDVTSSYGVENESLRPGSVSPALPKSTTPNKSKSTSEPESTTTKKTSSTPEPPTCTPKKLTATITPEPQGERSPRTKTPKDLGESKPKRRCVKKRESQSLDEVAKKQGNNTAASITIMKDLLVCDIFYAEV